MGNNRIIIERKKEMMRLGMFKVQDDPLDELGSLKIALNAIKSGCPTVVVDTGTTANGRLMGKVHVLCDDNIVRQAWILHGMSF